MRRTENRPIKKSLGASIGLAREKPSRRRLRKEPPTNPPVGRLLLSEYARKRRMSEIPVLRPGPPIDENGVRVRYGGCSCGALRFEVRGEPIKVGVCHCLECRKATGAPFVFYADWPGSAFQFT